MRPNQGKLAGICVLMCTVIIVASALSGCGNNKPSTTSTTTTALSTTTTTLTPIGAPPPLKLTPIATLQQPTAMDQRDGDDTIYVTEQRGTIRAIRNGVLDPTPVLDISSEVRSSGSEQGLLGIAFAPGKSTLYLDYTDTVGDTRIVEFTLGTDGLVDPRSRRELLNIDQPYPNHNGGQVAFGPDGMLYIGMGDGGSGGDPHKYGQNLTVLLGKILRINPTPTADAPYSIPFDNPFAKQQGARGEIWQYGLRNPWRFSFDKSEKHLWIADVGQQQLEEINLVENSERGGQNFGWSLREGTKKYSGDKPKDAIDPVYEYSHAGGACSITGGYAYRGKAIPDLMGRYLFGDFCTGKISTLTQRGTAWQSDSTTLSAANLASFGEDHNGELYVLSSSGAMSRIDPAT